MTRTSLALLGGGLLLSGLLLQAPIARAAGWRGLGRACETAGWHAWRASITAHDRYAAIMMDEAQKGPARA